MVVCDEGEDSEFVLSRRKREDATLKARGTKVDREGGRGL